MFPLLAYIDKGFNIVILQALLLQNVFIREKTQHFPFLLCFISYRQMEGETKMLFPIPLF